MFYLEMRLPTQTILPAGKIESIILYRYGVMEADTVKLDKFYL